MTPKYVSAFLLCFITGVAIGSLYFVNTKLVLELSLMLASIITILVVNSKRFSLVCLCIIIGFNFGLWYVGQSFRQNEYEKFIGRKIETVGVVMADPVTLEKNQQLILLPNNFNQHIKAQVYTPIPDINKGDEVWIRGQIEMPENFNDFDYIGYLQRWEIYALLKKPRVIVIKRAQPNWRTPLLYLRQYVVSKAKAFPLSEGSLIVGMLIGQRQNIPEEVSQAFKTTGLTHIVAVSGFNMTVIATACSALVWYLGRRNTNILTLVIVFGFVVITGASAAVVRAAIMSVLMVVAQLLGRQYASLYSLLIVSSIMILQNPRVLVWDIGFQLSVAATFGVLIAFRVKKPGTKETFFSETMRPTMGAIAITAPIIILHFHTFSVIAPIANLLVLPFVSWIMLFGALALIPVIGDVFVYPAQQLTSIVLFLTQKLAKVPYASIELHLPIYILAVYYFLLLIFIHHRINASLQNHVEDARL
jgi:competence protein ComEC